MGFRRQGGAQEQDENLTAEETVAEIIPEEPEKPAQKTQNEAQKRKHRRIRALRSFIFRAAALALVVYILFFQIVGLTTMPGSDMAPRVSAGDLLLFYRVDRNPRTQDIIVIDKAVNSDNSAASGENAEAETKRFVCRVIAAPGDTVEITEERGLQVNGNTLAESGILQATRPYEGYLEYPVVLGEGEYFVLSDARDGGADSRCFGPVKQEEIQGIVITLLRRNNL